MSEEVSIQGNEIMNSNIPGTR